MLISNTFSLFGHLKSVMLLQQAVYGAAHQNVNEASLNSSAVDPKFKTGSQTILDAKSWNRSQKRGRRSRSRIQKFRCSEPE